jgi:hypothetical protein
MSRTPVRPVFCLLAAVPLVVLLPSLAVGSEVYDVSYVWARSASNVLDYRDEVGRILGPGVAKDLQVVKRDGSFGVIYPRGGDSNGAVRVARVHTRLLKAGGLDPAAPIRSGDWTLVDGDPSAGQAAVVSVDAANSSSGKGRVPRRSPEQSGATVWVMVDGVLEPVVLAEQTDENSSQASSLTRWLQAAMAIFQSDSSPADEPSCAKSGRHTC